MTSDTDLFRAPEMTAVYPLEADEVRALETLAHGDEGARTRRLAIRLLALSSQIEDWRRIAEAGAADPKRAEALGLSVDDLAGLVSWRERVGDDIEAVQRVRNELAHGNHRVPEETLARAVAKAEQLVATNPAEI